MKSRIVLWLLLPAAALMAQGVETGGVILESHLGTRSYGIGGTIYFNTKLNINPRLGVQAYRILPAAPGPTNSSNSITLGLGISKYFYIDYEKTDEAIEYPKSIGNGNGVKIGGIYQIELAQVPFGVGGFIAFRSGNGHSHTEAGVQLSYTFGF